MMNVFGPCAVIPNQFRVPDVLLVNVFEAGDYLGALIGGEDSSPFQRKRMRMTRVEFMRQEPPVELERPLPLIEERVQRLAKAARPHLAGLFAHQFFSPFAPLFSCGISE